MYLAANPFPVTAESLTNLTSMLLPLDVTVTLDVFKDDYTSVINH